jgi:hypothetical protein
MLPPRKMRTLEAVTATIEREPLTTSTMLTQDKVVGNSNTPTAESTELKTRKRKQVTPRQVTAQSTLKAKLKKMLLQKYKKDVTSDMEVIYASERGRQIGSNLLRLIEQVIDSKNQDSKSFDRDLFVFYSINNKKVPLKLFTMVMPESVQIYAKAAKQNK